MITARGSSRGSCSPTSGALPGNRRGPIPGPPESGQKKYGPFVVLKMPEISPWQAGKESLNNRFRACWPFWHVCARIPKTRYDRRSILQDIRMDCSKG